MDQLDLQTPDFTAANIARLAELFPNCATETRLPDGTLKRAIDFDLLRQELSHDLVEGPQERYRLDWPGKREALALANAAIRKTLRPSREESVNFDTTRNLYIEGDNLDALKLLQETYLGQVKMIYIDPPYNTGNDFIYDDDFSMSGKEHALLSGDVDQAGNSMFDEEKWKQNLSSNGRFHSEWLSMIYPRLKLARNLLASNGLVFISINDAEIANLRKICDEVFGSSSFVTCFSWHKGKEGGNDSTVMRSHFECILLYARDAEQTDLIQLDPKDTSRHRTHESEPNLVAGITSEPRKGELYQPINLTKQKDYTVKIPLITGEIIESPSYSPQTSINQWIKVGKIFIGEKRVPYVKSYLADELQGQKPSNILESATGTTKSGSIEIRSILGNKNIFSYPKPSSLIKRLTYLGSKQDSIILDFFSGSATTAHAVMQLNAEDGGNRRHIMVQLPEPCDEKSEAFKAGYATIAEIGKERIRRAGQKVLAEWQAKQAKTSSAEGDLLHPPSAIHHPPSPPDIGFRVLKVDSSNFTDVYFQPDELTQDDLALQVDNLKRGRKPEDLLFQVLLDWGVDLALPVTEEQIAGRRVFFVDGDALAACFETGLDEAFVKALAARAPLRAVFRDAGYASDAVKINIEQIFKALSPHTELKTL